VRDVDDGDAALAQVAHEVEQALDLARGQRRRGLVHDDDVRGPRHRPGHGHALALPARQRLDGLGERAQPDLEVGHVPGGLLAHAFLVEHPEDLAKDAGLA
jgi:hypothetical protein